MVVAEMDDDLRPESPGTCVLGCHVAIAQFVQPDPTSFSQENNQKRDFLSHLEDERTEVWRLRDTAQTPCLAHPSGADGEVSSPSGKVTTG